MAKKRVGGILSLQRNGEVYHAKGNFSYHLGTPTREAIVNADGSVFYKETPTQAYFEGEITDPGDLDLRAVALGDEDTITGALANGKTVVFRDAWFAGEMIANTEEGNVSVRWEAQEGEEI